MRQSKQIDIVTTILHELDPGFYSDHKEPGLYCQITKSKKGGKNNVAVYIKTQLKKKVFYKGITRIDQRLYRAVATAQKSKWASELKGQTAVKVSEVTAFEPECFGCD